MVKVFDEFFRALRSEVMNVMRVQSQMHQSGDSVVLRVDCVHGVLRQGGPNQCLKSCSARLLSIPQEI